MIPTEECDPVEHHRPTACTECGAKLSGDDPDPQRHQVTDLPPVKPIVTEHQIHTLQCPDCGCRCRAQLPADVPRGSFGPGIVAVVRLLTSLGRLSQRMIASLLRELFSLEVADGQISRLQSIGRKALQAGHDAIAADVRESAVLNIDETGWRQNGKKAWLWTIVGRFATLFAVCASRAREELHALLGEDFSGIVVSDRYSAYNHLDDDRRQFCWAHLIRDFQAMIDRGGSSADAGLRLKSFGQQLIHHWNRLQDRTIQRATFDRHFREIRAEILDALLDGSQSDHAKTAETCRRLSNECSSLFVFVHHDGVSPTNNAAEQALRKTVIFRELSFGTEAQTGSQNLTVSMSVAETCRRLGKRPLDYIAAVVHAAFDNKPAPQLLPKNCPHCERLPSWCCLKAAPLRCRIADCAAGVPVRHTAAYDAECGTWSVVACRIACGTVAIQPAPTMCQRPWEKKLFGNCCRNGVGLVTVAADTQGTTVAWFVWMMQLDVRTRLIVTRGQITVSAT